MPQNTLWNNDRRPPLWHISPVSPLASYSPFSWQQQPKWYFWQSKSNCKKLSFLASHSAPVPGCQLQLECSVWSSTLQPFLLSHFVLFSSISGSRYIHLSVSQAYQVHTSLSLCSWSLNLHIPWRHLSHGCFIFPVFITVWYCSFPSSNCASWQQNQNLLASPPITKNCALQVLKTYFSKR